MLRTSLKSATLRSVEDLGKEEAPPVWLIDPFRFSRMWRRKILYLHEHGFRLQHWGKEECVLCSDIQSIAVTESECYANGILISKKQKIILRIDGGSLVLRHLSPVVGDDGLASFINKVTIRLAEKYEMTKTLEGQNWSLDAEGFHTKDHNLTWQEIGYVDVVDNNLCLWRSNETYPLVRIHYGSPQARVLNEILERYTKEKPQAPASDSLGRFLFSRRTNRSLFKFIIATSAALLITGAFLLTLGSRTILPGLLLLFLGGPVALYGIFALRRVFRFHQNGLIQEPGHKVLFYSRCESLVYDVNLQFINGIYAFTRIQMSLQGTSGSMSIKIQRYGNDAELEQARVEISTKIAERMYQKLAIQREVPWGKLARITAHEVNYLSSSLWKPNIRSTIPFTQPISYSMDSGKFYLFRAGEPVPLFEMDCDEENFYPGFFLLLKLVSEH